ncbi:MAG: AAA family ATPase, partial [Bacteroidota bacterium]
MNKPYIVGICGASASGKSYLLQEMVRRLPGQQISLISQDNYYKKLEEQHRDEDGHVNFDHPDSIHLDELLADLPRLIKGETISRMEYTFNNPAVTPKMIQVEPANIIIVEGLFIYYLEAMRRLMDLKLFVEADEHIRLERRLRRDYEER